jgi:subtilisin-like proprotein convertase family protein
VNDGGMDANHAEFQGRLDIESSCNLFEPTASETSDAYHGTAVAAIIGAAGNNGECSVGIAPEVTLSSCNFLAFQNESLVHNMESIDISSNSFGVDGCGSRSRRHLQDDVSNTICPFKLQKDGDSFSPCDVCDFSGVNISYTCERSIISYCQVNFKQDMDGCLEFLDIIIGGKCEYNVLPDPIRNDITRGINEGRQGKGIVFVFASGNAFYYGDSTVFQPFTNSRFVISVGAVDKDENHASYSTGGPNLFVVGPGGSEESSPNHVTADLGGGCRDASYGTSLATPVVSGVVALMLNANPDLTWRDVQWILATNSHIKEDDPYDDTSIINGAGIRHSQWYGFGLVDAAAAVNASKTWEIVDLEQMLIGESGVVDITIPDGPSSSPLLSSINIVPENADSVFIAESVVVYLDIVHSSRGQLEITLTSPQGTTSILSPGQRPENSLLKTDERWKLMSVQFWGEQAIGEWTLSVVDSVEGDVDVCISQPWNVVTAEGTDVRCLDLERLKLCVDGILDPTNLLDDVAYDTFFNEPSDGLFPSDACCACGGGIISNSFNDQLRQWRLVVYGQGKNVIGSQSGSSSKRSSYMGWIFLSLLVCTSHLLDPLR